MAQEVTPKLEVKRTDAPPPVTPAAARQQVVTVVKANATDGSTVLVEDQVTAHLLDRGNVSIQSLPQEYQPSDFTALPKTGRRITRILDNPGKTQIQDDETVQDVNTHLKYIYFGAREMRDPNNLAYDRHFIPVTRGRPGSENIPEHYFDDSGLIRQRENVLCMCDMRWWQSRIAVEKGPIKQRLDTIASPYLRRRQTTGGTEVTQSLDQTEIK